MPDSITRPTDLEFCPDEEDMFLVVMGFLPRGRAWQTVDFNKSRDTVLKKFYYSLGVGLKQYEDKMCSALNQWFCFSADEDLDLWKLEYGIPDECDLYNASVCAKAEISHSPTAQYLLDLLESNGYVADGRWLTGHDVEFGSVFSTFYVVVNVSLSPAFVSRTELPFELGAGRTLGFLEVSQIQCMLERYVPAECAVQIELSDVFTLPGNDATMMVVGM